MLDLLVQSSIAECNARKKTTPRSMLEFHIASQEPPKSLGGALTRGGISIIAEVKRRSPSGTVSYNTDAAARAVQYMRGGARAISVLTNHAYFGGSLDDLAAVHTAVDLPILRKDFITDPYQIYEARAYGADAVLLIARVLAKDALRALVDCAASLGMQALVEVRSEEEITKAIDSGAQIIGVNARDLETHEIDTEHMCVLLESVPDEYIRVAESGIACREDVARARNAGADAVLVGTALIRLQNPEVLIGELLAI